MRGGIGRAERGGICRSLRGEAADECVRKKSVIRHGAENQCNADLVRQSARNLRIIAHGSEDLPDAKSVCHFGEIQSIITRGFGQSVRSGNFRLLRGEPTDEFVRKKSVIRRGAGSQCGAESGGQRKAKFANYCVRVEKSVRREFGQTISTEFADCCVRIGIFAGR